MEDAAVQPACSTTCRSTIGSAASSSRRSGTKNKTHHRHCLRATNAPQQQQPSQCPCTHHLHCLCAAKSPHHICEANHISQPAALTTCTACAPPGPRIVIFKGTSPHIQAASQTTSRTHHLHCLCATSTLQVKLAACPASLHTLSCRHSWVRLPSTVVRTLQTQHDATELNQLDSVRFSAGTAVCGCQAPWCAPCSQNTQYGEVQRSDGVKFGLVQMQLLAGAQHTGEHPAGSCRRST